MTEVEKKRSRVSDKVEDSQFVARILARDVRAFEELYQIYRPRLARFLTVMLKRPPLVEEVLNDTMMVVWERLDSFRGESALSTWIFAIAYRKGARALQRNDQPADPIDPDLASSDADPEETTGARRSERQLAAALNKLSADHRTVVDLTYFHELGYREIAEIMGCPVDTVKTRMFHARRHLRGLLAGEKTDWL